MATFTNQATLSYNGNIASSNITTGEIVDVLTAAKTAVRGTYRAGDPMTFVISLVNTGTTELNGLTVTDDLGAYEFGGGTVTPLTYTEGTVTYYVNGVQQPTVVPAAEDPLTLTGIRVPAGGDAVIVYEAVPNRFAPLGAGGTVDNTATVNGAGLTAPVSADIAVAAAEEPVLSVNKTLSPSVVQENGTVTYTFTIQNTGSAAVTEEGDAILRDTFDPALSITSVTFNGSAWSDPDNYTYDAASGEFATADGALTVPAAVFAQDPDTGEQNVTPGVSTLVVTGTI